MALFCNLFVKLPSRETCLQILVLPHDGEVMFVYKKKL